MRIEDFEELNELVEKSNTKGVTKQDLIEKITIVADRLLPNKESLEELSKFFENHPEKDVVSTLLAYISIGSPGQLLKDKAALDQKKSEPKLAVCDDVFFGIRGKDLVLGFNAYFHESSYVTCEYSGTEAVRFLAGNKVENAFSIKDKICWIKSSNDGQGMDFIAFSNFK